MIKSRLEEWSGPEEREEGRWPAEMHI